MGEGATRIFIYSRKSVCTGRGESIENQVEMCRQYIAGRIEGGGEAELTVYEDEGFSGKSMDRPQFQRMLSDARRRKPDYIVCYRLDRISRSVGDFAPLVEDLIARDIGLVCIREQFDTSTPMGKAMMYIASVFAQLERETIAERVRDNMLLLARTGRWLGGTPPTGFLSERTGEVVLEGKTKTACKLKWNPQEIGTAKTIFQKFLELRSVSGVGRYLAEQGVRSRSGKPYSLPGLKEILKNPVYCVADRCAREYFLARGAQVCFGEGQCSGKYGLLAYNKRDHSRRGAPRLPESEWIIAVGRHRGIVSGREWVAVQDALQAGGLPGERARPFNGYALLSGVLRCKRCGARMFAKRRSGSGTRFDYICASKLQAGGRCTCQNLGGKEADEAVCAFLTGRVQMDDAGFCRLLRAQHERLGRREGGTPNEVEARLAKYEREIAQLVSSLSQPGVGPALIARVNSRVTALDEQLSALKTQKERLQAGCGDARAQEERLFHSLACLRDGFEGLNSQEKRELIRLTVQKIEWDGERCDVFLYGE